MANPLVEERLLSTNVTTPHLLTHLQSSMLASLGQKIFHPFAPDNRSDGKSGSHSLVEFTWTVRLPFVSMKAWYVASFQSINGFSHLRPKTCVLDLLQRVQI